MFGDLVAEENHAVFAGLGRAHLGVFTAVPRKAAEIDQHFTLRRDALFESVDGLGGVLLLGRGHTGRKQRGNEEASHETIF
jgi:hypothetical protein